MGVPMRAIAPDRRQVPERQLQPQAEQQQRDANLGEAGEFSRVADREESHLRADDDPGEQVTEHERLPQEAGDHAAAEAGNDDEDEVGRHPIEIVSGGRPAFSLTIRDAGRSLQGRIRMDE